ncbi:MULTISPECIES: bifunctional 4-hydroxy-2-oxoglutarate aldolase/2-dehydro-3-deoxy-phosphogluconate aldolase [Gammaproteobacteria]|uniref:bifunctional 4-hydroxy-2-oxoglutarate aldolase/2-dehydro-3-deoxy-phosphogluconate aldolase n=1 Tax=Gammaproteobacteria TaxID=1236 RepID=UPI000DD06792|nr:MULTISPECIES: bifunctional 4-hydroxy-2-oxoglutarate aldolase/2-dehydro-3-deoxy-phosphogluconate aldolase [Gammaproteobacteria]RTE86279.1 bifunctional 4-hydroxy-2-oxoglutarate aldolase/2-dehydro-3-deoxy-phosphogluconate aldolase [Aliidiomarina sp. B3213]TCZ91630.1 bifunctional 4-hydroxy-2-oxoglutarate aldolase/2-dehydro-3-deoxy-phosphogluconate aldolase [Lysobacter sp. N42]
MSFKHWKHQPEYLMSLTPIVPVIVINDLDDAVPLAKALVGAGIKLLEVTLRSDVALEAISRIAEFVPEAVVGAGTVSTPEELDSAQEAGAEFAISPGITPELLDSAAAGSIPLIPGISTVSELMYAKSKGYTHLKFFPAEAAGGVPMLQAIAGPFPAMRFCPTGGISAVNASNYLELNNVLCVGGSWILPKDVIADKNWEKLKKLAAAALPKK